MWDWIGKLAQLRDLDATAVLVTVVGTAGSSPREPGAKMIVTALGERFGTIGGGHLEEQAISEAKEVAEKGESRLSRYPLGAKSGQCCGGVVELFFEVLNQGPLLYFFGAGHVGQAVCRVLDGTPFRVHLIDERTEWVSAPDLPKSVVPHEEGWEIFIPRARWDERRVYTVVATHSHDVDFEILLSLLKQPQRYLGLIGSDSKAARFRDRLLTRGVSTKDVERVRCPIGIPIGGKTPTEIAVSLAAEILRIHHEK